MTKPFTRKLLAGVVLGCMTTLAAAETPPVQLHIDAANSNGGIALLSESGWPLTIKMVIDFPEGEELPAYAIQPNYAVRGDWGFIIFEDKDECLNPPIPSWNVDTYACGLESGDPIPASDEVYMEFWPDVDMVGIEDNTGNTDRQADLVDSAGSRGPEFQKWYASGTCVPGTDDSDCIRMGPSTGEEIVDGYGLGADDDIPGLVIVSEYGVGRVFDEPDFELSDPVGAVNLAGLINSVAYDLSDLQKESSKAKGDKGKPTETITEQARIWAHINMPIDVIRHLIKYDACTGNVTWEDSQVQMYATACDGNDLWRIDGGPAEEPTAPYHQDDKASIALLEDTTYTLKVFLVSGQAPNRLFDEDGDGDVDSADATAAGYIVLSNEDSISFLQLSQLECWGGGGGVFGGDLDDNGADALSTRVCPAGPGDLKRPPR